LASRGVPVFRARVVPDAATLAGSRGKRVLAFAGIGDPGRFFRTLRDHGIAVAAERTFPDHHRFTRDEIARLRDEAARDGLAPVTTEKDFSRIGGDDFAALRDAITALPVTLRFDDEARLRALVRGVVVKV
ncbi:MAG: tetraacyldisaccharide 4'-kinase, partial [Xanthobacteraceae bacterium]